MIYREQIYSEKKNFFSITTQNKSIAKFVVLGKIHGNEAAKWQLIFDVMLTVFQKIK